MNEIERIHAQQIYEEEKRQNQNCPSGHIVNSAHKKAAFDMDEKRCHFGNTQKFQGCCLCQS